MVDGAKIGHPVDLYVPQPIHPDTETIAGMAGFQLCAGVRLPVTTAAPEKIADLDLKGGTHVLGVEVTGKNKASKGYDFALDYIKLVPLPSPALER
jgi:hypothetical protein